MRRGHFFAMSLCSATVWACASLVGISDAELDPEFRAGAGGDLPNGEGGAPAGGRSGGAGPGGTAGASGNPSADAGSSGEGGATSGAGGASEGGAGGAENLCEEYCEVVTRNCSGALAVYTSEEVCLRACAVLPQGTRGDTSGNSVACRLDHARQIDLIGEAATQCPIAGPGGAGICGENCEGFCEIRRGICEADLDLSECNEECSALQDLGGYTVAVTDGPTVQCRLYHVSAATFGTAVHCPHAAGIGPCAAP